MRRKRFSKWIPYLNVLSDWSTEYRFFARHAKLTLNSNLLSYSYLTFNPLRVSSTSREFINSFSKYKGASHLNIFYSYFNQTYSNKVDLSLFKNSALLSVNSITPLSLTPEPSLFIPYLQAQTNLYSPTDTDVKHDCLNLIQNLGIIYQLSYSKELYKVTTLLCLKFTFNG